MPAPTEIKKTTQLLFLWFVFFNAQLLYALLPFLQWRLRNPGQELGSVSFWQSHWLGEPLFDGALSLALFAWVAGLFFPRLMAHRLVGLSPTERAERYFKVALMGYVLIEISGLWGVLFVFLPGDPLRAFPFIGLALTGLLARYPSERRTAAYLGETQSVKSQTGKKVV